MNKSAKTMVKGIGITALLVIGLLFIVQIGIFASAQENVERGPNYEITCQNDGLCEARIYSYEKYWYENGEWGEMDEAFFDCSDTRTKYCTRSYNYNVIADSDGFVSAFLDGQEFGVKLTGFLEQPLSYSVSARGNIVTYSNIVPGVDLVYKYLPNELKEEIVINEPLRNLPRDNFEVTFSKRGNANFMIRESTICDSRGYCETIPASITENGVTLEVPVSFLNNERIVYPVYIDPTIQLTDSSIKWNGRVAKDTYANQTLYKRTHNPSSDIIIGYLPAVAVNVTDSYGRGDIDWNISAISDSSSISTVRLQAYISSSLGGTVSLNVTHMDGNNASYPETTGECEGNCDFYNDMGDGTVYNSSNYATGGVYTINLNGAESDVLSHLSDNVFSTGLSGFFNGNASVWIGSRDNSNSSRRPVLIIKYGANQTDANAAIEEGIDNSALGVSQPVSSGKQVYLVNQSGDQTFGRFDKLTVLGNQTWALTYADTGESLINMPSLFQVLNVLEGQGLTYNQIRDQVALFINNTIY
ncbi:hypothetical protein CO038_00660 [Candidatus Pacearchaeota archaeon CG_4_9_14_0_2_um_filter_39_13]|nr:MAG: hypothetical protein CO038_00660 [Candidatus Pacearchaeota archaeon CG_4_9_14_0_2_um_filter_39_13]